MKLYDISNSEKNNFSCVYMWTNLVNGKKYVGQTQCFGNRMSNYRCGRFNDYMKHAIQKYGIDNFDVSILERDVPYDMLDEREQYWMDYYKSYEEDYGYNICRFAGSTKERKASERWCKEHSDWLKEKWATDEKYRKFWSDRMSGENNYFYGKDCSGDKNGHAKSIICVEKNKIYTTVKEAAKENNTSRQNISHVLNGRQETAGGYHWEYV